ncbi:MAG: DUF3078 domain-containing protein [Ferruginibacter sp.]
MKKTTLLLILINFCFFAKAQDATVKDLKASASAAIKKDAADTAQKTWKKGGFINMNVNQGSLSNWSAGGDKFSFSLNAYVNLYAFYKKDKNSWDNSLDLAYGLVNTTSLGNRKSSDRIEYLSKYGHALSKKWDAGLLFDLRSQFANGYAYLKNSVGADSSSLTSKTFAPTYIILSPGFNYKPCDNFSLFLSPITARWIIVSDNLLAPIYGVPAGKKSRQEFGAFASAAYHAKIGKSFTYQTKLDLFSNYKHDPQDIDIYWTNVVSAKITKYINFNFNLDVIYDNDTRNVNPAKGPAPQILQLMGIGFAYNFKN